MTAPEAFALGLQHHQAGRLKEAEALYRQVLAVQPGHADALQLLGVVAHQAGRSDLAIERINRAIVLDPQNSTAHYNLGEIYLAEERVVEATAEFRRALEIRPHYPKAQHNLGVALTAQGQLDAAIVAYRRALALEPGHAMARYSLGNALLAQGQLDEAAACYEEALQLEPNLPEACINLGAALRDKGCLDSAMAAYRHALELRPDYAIAHNNFGNIFKDQGELDDAIHAYRQALGIEPNNAAVRSNLIYALQCHPAQNQNLVRTECERWNQQFGFPTTGAKRFRDYNRDPGRRLRIGYVSPGFCSNAVAFFLAPLLEAHHREGYEIHCYASVPRPDLVTERLRKSADAWHDVRTLSDQQLADRVRADGIDLLVDLSMHTGENRLPAFACRPAPVQVSWLAYPGSSGLEAIDYRITDAHIDPPDRADDEWGGKPFRLPDAWCCYLPIEEFPPVGPLPTAAGAPVTFGSVNRGDKIHEGLLCCWARLLQAVPTSRLLMICPEGKARERTYVLFSKHGIARDRIEMVPLRPWPDYTRLFERIDLALDAFPCNGMTTTCHTLWMGVPVVTQTGTSALSRAGNSLLRTIGLADWIAESEDQYIRIAAEKAADFSHLANLRATLRARIRSSPLMDAPRFARNMEAAYRAMWQRWCADISSSRT